MADADPRTDTATRERLAQIQAGYERWQKVTLRALILTTVLWAASTGISSFLYTELQAGRAESRMLRVEGTEQLCDLARSVFQVASAAEQAGRDESFTGPLRQSVNDCERLLEEYRQPPMSD